MRLRARRRWNQKLILSVSNHWQKTNIRILQCVIMSPYAQQIRARIFWGNVTEKCAVLFRKKSWKGMYLLLGAEENVHSLHLLKMQVVHKVLHGQKQQRTQGRGKGTVRTKDSLLIRPLWEWNKIWLLKYSERRGVWGWALNHSCSWVTVTRWRGGERWLTPHCTTSSLIKEERVSHGSDLLPSLCSAVKYTARILQL